MQLSANQAYGCRYLEGSTIKGSLTSELILPNKSDLDFSNITVVKDTPEIRECSADTRARVELTPDGARRVQSGGIIPAAIVDTLKKPSQTRYVIRMNDDRRTFTVEFFPTH